MIDRRERAVFGEEKHRSRKRALRRSFINILEIASRGWNILTERLKYRNRIRRRKRFRDHATLMWRDADVRSL